MTRTAQSGNDMLPLTIPDGELRKPFKRGFANPLFRRTFSRHSAWLAIALLLAWISSTAVHAEAPEPLATTTHEAQIEGTRYTYTAEASRIPIRHAETGELRGSMFYVSYSVPPRPGSRRPIIFSWGGGPSGPALGMHMTYGPRTSTSGGEIVDNQLSLLSVADLVFVDPIGTGFSRAANGSFLDEFYSTMGDARSVAEFIRVWIALHGAETAPIYLSGQSYGVWRAAIVGELLEQSGRTIDGLILTSGGMGIANEFNDPAYSDAYRVPDFAAAAFTHGRLAPELGRSEQEAWEIGRAWAKDVYGPALSRLAEIGQEERERISGELSRRTGYPVDRINRETLVISAPEFLRHFLGQEGLRLNTFDMRRIDGGAERQISDNVETRARATYLREDLGYRTDLAYLGLEAGYVPATGPDYLPIGTRWNYNSGQADLAAAARAGQGPPGAEPWVLRTLEANPNLRIFVETGIYDSLNYCEAYRDRIRRMPESISDKFELHCYFAGHGSFRDPTAYPHVMRDIRAFVSIGGQRP
jgi:hypothetical protein